MTRSVIGAAVILFILIGVLAAAGGSGPVIASSSIGQHAPGYRLESVHLMPGKREKRERAEPVQDARPQQRQSGEASSGESNEQWAGAPILGLHGALDERIIADTGIEAFRVILKDYQLEAARNRDGSTQDPEMLRKLRSLHARGIQVIITIRYTAGENLKGKADIDVIPNHSDQARKLALTRQFLLKAGPYISGFSLANEVTGGPGALEETVMTPAAAGQPSPAIDWYKELAKLAREIRESAPEYRHLAIISPALSDGVTLAMATNRSANETKRRFVDELIEFSEEYCDYLDVHLHIASIEDMREILKYVRQRTEMPLLTLEWSPAHALKDWLYEPAENQARYRGLRNGEVIRNAYANKLSAKEWNEFIKTAPLETDIMRKQYDLMHEYGFRWAIYGGAYQFQHPIFDTVAIYANHTAVGSPPNGVVHEQFKKLAEYAKTTRR